MSISALQAAKIMGETSGWKLSNLEMQKLLYLAHMLHLGISKKPLVDGSFEAWHLGPVHPELYHELKVFGADPVYDIFRSVPKPEAEDCFEKTILQVVLRQFSELSQGDLVGLTHWKNGAWARNYIPGSHGNIIPNSHITEEYKHWFPESTEDGREPVKG